MLLNVKPMSWGAGCAAEMIRLIVEKRLGILATLWWLNRSR
jgi:hypothetical protein